MPDSHEFIEGADGRCDGLIAGGVTGKMRCGFGPVQHGLPGPSSGRLSRVDAPDPAAVMAAHRGLNWCTACSHEELCNSELVPWPCESYRLAEALAAEQAKVAKLERWRPLTRAEISHYCQHGRKSHLCICGVNADHANDVCPRAALADQPEQAT